MARWKPRLSIDAADTVWFPALGRVVDADEAALGHVLTALQLPGVAPARRPVDERHADDDGEQDPAGRRREGEVPALGPDGREESARHKDNAWLTYSLPEEVQTFCRPVNFRLYLDVSAARTTPVIPFY